MSASRKGSRKIHFSGTLFTCCEIPARGERIPKDVTQMAVGKKLSALLRGETLNNTLKKQLSGYLKLIEVTNGYIGMNRELESHLTFPISDISETLLSKIKSLSAEMDKELEPYLTFPISDIPETILSKIKILFAEMDRELEPYLTFPIRDIPETILSKIKSLSAESSEAISKAMKGVRIHLHNGAENIFRKTLFSLYALLKEEEEQKNPTDHPYALLREIYHSMLDASQLMSSEDICINTGFLINMTQVMNMLMKLEKKQYKHTKRDRSSFASIESELCAIHEELRENPEKQKILSEIMERIREFALLKNKEILDEKLDFLKQNLSHATGKTKELIKKLTRLRADKYIKSKAGVAFYQEINYLLTAFRMSAAAKLVCQLEDRHMFGLVRLKKEGLVTPEVGHIILLANEIIEEIARHDTSDYSGEGQYSEISDEEALDYIPNDEDDVSVYTATDKDVSAYMAAPAPSK